MKFGVNFCQTLTLLSPLCSLPCCSLSACQNNEGKKNAAFRGQSRDSLLSACMNIQSCIWCVRIHIHLKALIRTLDLCLWLLSKSLLSLFDSFSFLESGRVREGEVGTPLEVDYSSVDWPVTNLQGGRQNVMSLDVTDHWVRAKALFKGGVLEFSFLPLHEVDKVTHQGL